MNRLNFSFHVPASHPSLLGHFPGHPIVPGVLLLDHVLAKLHEATGRHVACLHRVKFSSGLHPDEVAHAMCEIEGERASFCLTARRHGAPVTLATGSLSLQSRKVLQA